MWSKVAKEMGIPWRAVEAMHWHLGSKRWPVAPVWHRFHGPKILFEPPRTMSGHLCDGNGKVSRVHHGNFHHAQNYLPVSQCTKTENGKSEWKILSFFFPCRLLYHTRQRFPIPLHGNNYKESFHSIEVRVIFQRTYEFFHFQYVVR